MPRRKYNDPRITELIYDEAEVVELATKLAAERTRAETLLAAINYAIEQGFECEDWLRAWRDGDPGTMAELEAARAKGEPAA